MFEGFNETFARTAIARSAENPVDRRRFMRAAGLTGIGVAAVGALGAAGAGPALADISPPINYAPSDSAVLNFALNLEYLEAEYYLRAVNGYGLSSVDITGTTAPGVVYGGYKVNFQTTLGQQYAYEIAQDEKKHVQFLRSQLGMAAVSRPTINFTDAFTAVGKAAGFVKKGQRFDPFSSESNFLLGAFIFEDVGVTAYKGAAPLIYNKNYVEAAAGILAVEAYHASLIRTLLLAKGLDEHAGQISKARDSLDGSSDDDQGIVDSHGHANIVPTDSKGLVYSRTTGRVLNIAYLNKGAVTQGGFFPLGVNGVVNLSGSAPDPAPPIGPI